MMKRFLLSFGISLIAFTLIFTGFGKVLFEDNNSLAFTPEENYVENGEIDEEKPVGKTENEILFLMMGVDSKDIKKSDGTRTDTLMLMKANFDTGEIGIFSLPRDTRVLVKGKKDKLNHAHAYGGPELTMKTVRDFTGLDVEHYVKVDYKAVKEIVDAIGGVELDVPTRMYYNDPTADPPLNINLKKGLQVLDGDDAHDFLRYRSGYSDGDLGRVAAQQYFMKELIKQTLKPRNIFKLPKLVETYYDYVETNIPMNTILKGVVAANKMDVENIDTNTVPGENKRIDGLDYLIYDREETDMIIRRMFKDYL